MSLATEPCLQLLNRAYCYLRFSGMDAATACQNLHALMEGLTDFDPQGGRDAESRERLWQQVVERAAVPRDAPPGGAEMPPLLRGHIRYGDPGR
jgi:hypothetical protein